MALSISSVVKLNSGHTMPLLGFGVFQSTNAFNSVTSALEVGYRHIDSARYYHNEPEVAEAVRKSNIDRSSIFVTTKVMSSEHGTSSTSSAIQDSLKRSGLDYFDLILLHDPNSGKKKRLEAYKVLQDYKDKDKIKSFGVSNFGVKHLKEIKEAGLATPAINQIELHPWCAQKEIVSYCQKEGIVVQAYCPLVRGARMKDPTLVEVAQSVNKTPAQVLIRWCLQKNFVPLPKSDTPSRIKENADVYDFELSKDHMAKLDALDQGKNGACSWNPVDAP